MLILLFAAFVVGAVIALARSSHTRPWIAILAGVVFIACMWAFFDPYANIPGVSQVVCSLKGDSWYGSSVLGPAGCYARP